MKPIQNLVPQMWALLQKDSKKTCQNKNRQSFDILQYKYFFYSPKGIMMNYNWYTQEGCWAPSFFYYPLYVQTPSHMIDPDFSGSENLATLKIENESQNKDKRIESEIVQNEAILSREEFLPCQSELSEKMERKSEFQQRKKWENTNKNKNIFPNTINRLISFLSCKARSNKILQKFIVCNPSISSHCSAKKYFSYMKLLKPKMNRCLMEQTIEKLFEFSDPEFQIFSQEEQECFIRINAFLFSHYVRSPLHVLYVVHSNCLFKENIPDYIKADRLILERIRSIYKECEVFKKMKKQQYQ